jgi:hypothetical protein
MKIMKRNLILTLAFLTLSVFCLKTVSAQFPIKIPKLPKVEKPKQEQPKTDGGPATQTQELTKNQQTQARASKKIYGRWTPPAKQVFLKDTVHIKTEQTSTYYKQPKQRDYTSWIPTVSFDLCCGEEGYFYELNFSVDYYNPDGSLWFTQKLKSSRAMSAEKKITVSVEDNASISQMLETKASVGTGDYGIKIVNTDTGETVFQGKFKVEKFLRPYSEGKPNNFTFYVNHDWLLPVAYVAFDHTNFREQSYGLFPVYIQTWLKGDISQNELEARVSYKGQQIPATSSASSSVERTSHGAINVPNPPIWKLWQFQWDNLRFANGSGGNRDNYPGAHYVDENPGDYTVKIFHKGTQVREIKFTVQPDGRIYDAGFSKQVFPMHNSVIVPAKVVGTTEKWNPNAWKTDMFYGNPLSEFTVQ